jgi:type I restriction enzyme R subunit
MIALDIADHFKTKVKPNGFKAQVVAPSRLAAIRYAKYLNDFHVRAYPIITTSANDGIEFKEAMELNQDQVTNSFKLPDGEPEVLVVVDMLLTGFDAPVEQVLYLDRGLQEHGLLQAVARVNRPFGHDHDGVATEKGYGLVVDYYGVSRNLEAALQAFDLSDVVGTMRELEEDPTVALEAAVVAAEAHFKGPDLDDVWDCIAVFAPDANTDGNFKVDVYERFNADYREFARLMDRAIPSPKALPYVGRLARLTEIRAYARAHFLQEDVRLNWTDIGAKVKKLIDERIDANVRELMEPVSVLDKDFDQKIAGLPHDEARASVMEHTIRAYINERLADNPVFYGKLSEQLERIIQDLRNKVIDAAEAAKLQAALKAQLDAEEDIAAQMGLSAEAFAIYEIIDEAGTRMISEGERAAYHVGMDEAQKEATEKVESALSQHRAVVDWQTNQEVQRLMRRDIKRELRDGEKYTEAELDDLANRIVDAFRSRGSR